MSVDSYCMLLDFSESKSEEIVIGVFVGLIVLAYVRFVWFYQDGESLREEMNKAVQHNLIIVQLRKCLVQ